MGSALVHHAQQLAHLFVKEALAGTVRLHPLAIDDKLRNGALAGALDDLRRRAGCRLDVDFLVGDVVLLEEALGRAAVRTPRGRVNDQPQSFFIILE